MSDMPLDLKAVRDQGLLKVTWADGDVEFPFVFLRRECQCAHCVNEWTGERILDPTSVADSITIEKMDLVGSYAVRIDWSDGHNSGLYTWPRLRELRELL